jgi:hypothetical protein
MRFYTDPHRFYCGVDLHATTLYVCILDASGTTILHRIQATWLSHAHWHEGAAGRPAGDLYRRRTGAVCPGITP